MTTGTQPVVKPRMYTAEVIADSVSPEGFRITTVKVIYPHAVHKDMLRHRNQNRNVESFRAQPPEVLLANLRSGHAFRPDVFAKRTKGMGQGAEAIEQAQAAEKLWQDHIDHTLAIADEFLEMDIAKQQVNFLLQDLCPLTEIITATDWDNFFALRTELKPDGTPMARPEVYKTALAIREAIEHSIPVPLKHGEIHLPMVTEEELEVLRRTRATHPSDKTLTAHENYLIDVSAGRCAKISYGDYKWWAEPAKVSRERAQRIMGAGHMSPYEQQARCFSPDRWAVIRRCQRDIARSLQLLPKVEREEICRQLEYSGNLHGWIPARKNFPYEYDYGRLKQQLKSTA